MCRKENHERRPLFLVGSSAQSIFESSPRRTKMHEIDSKKRRMLLYIFIRSVRKNFVPFIFTCLFFGCLKIGYQIGMNLTHDIEEDQSRNALRKQNYSKVENQTSATKSVTVKQSSQEHSRPKHLEVKQSSHPYERIWPGLKLPDYMHKDSQFDIKSVPADKKSCFVHVGKTAGSTVGCSLGFNLHCESKVRASEFLLSNYTTNMFHSQMYDCDDETTAFFIFVVRNPMDRWISAFNYDNPSRDWDGFRKQYGEKHFMFRHKLYAECPFDTVNDVGEALSPNSNVTDMCKSRAKASIDGTEHFGCHHYFNYQFHLEAIPRDATIMTLRTEHLVEDWNSIERQLGGEEVLEQDNKVIARNNVNKASNNKLKYLSEESRRLICAKLCNEIESYKKILRLSINLIKKQVQESIDEFMDSCPIEALATTCNDPMPNITDKLVNSRGYLA